MRFHILRGSSVLITSLSVGEWRVPRSPATGKHIWSLQGYTMSRSCAGCSVDHMAPTELRNLAT